MSEIGRMMRRAMSAMVAAFGGVSAARDTSDVSLQERYEERSVAMLGAAHGRAFRASELAYEQGRRQERERILRRLRAYANALNQRAERTGDNADSAGRDVDDIANHIERGDL